MLCRLGFKFLRACDIRNKSNVDINCVFSADFGNYLTDSFEERCGFDVADSTADLGDNDVSILFLADTVNSFLDLICDMWDDLNSSAEIVSPALLVENSPVYLTCCNVGVHREIFIDETLIVAEVEVGLSTVIGNENFAMLIWGHCTRVEIYIRVKLLNCNAVASFFKQTAK